MGIDNRNLNIHSTTCYKTIHDYASKTNLMPHFIIFEISMALNNDFQADCSDLFRFLIELSIPKL